MKVAKIESVCECQAELGAELDEKRLVLRGWARDRRHDDVLNAPANVVGKDAAVLQVGWLCPFCTRNTLRLFQASGLRWQALEAV